LDSPLFIFINSYGELQLAAVVSLVWFGLIYILPPVFGWSEDSVKQAKITLFWIPK
jgi:hypothetical protein